MKNEYDSRFILSVFDKICKNGQQQQGKHLLEGLEAFTDHDGYTLFIEDALVKMRFGFHNQYHFDYQKSEHLEQFDKKLQAIARNYS